MFADSALPSPSPGKSNSTDLPRIVISVGEVSGVGPELALRCASLPEVTRRCTPILAGPEAIIRQIAQRLDLFVPPRVLDVGNQPDLRARPGDFSAATGQASYEAVCSGIDAALSGQAAALVTGPIQKEAWHLAGIRFPGHTELLSQRTGATEYAMMLTAEEISCALVTTHVPLADVAGLLSVESILRTIRLAAEGLRRRMARSPRITVCGLNPHAGENGILSHGEEEALIAPAIAAARQQGLEAVGPVPPDTAFTPAMRARTDVYVCMYHDQGLIPLKALAFDRAVNVTLGLPIIRTSVDHGTALDLAWQGKADHGSMLAAIQLAIDLIE